MARTAVAALAALALVACAAAGAHVCKSPGCKQCDFVMKSEKKGQQEVCTLCDEAAGYFLKKKGVCGGCSGGRCLGGSAGAPAGWARARPGSRVQFRSARHRPS